MPAAKKLTPAQEKVLEEEAKSRNNIVPNNVDRGYRTLVVCFDGTGDQEDADVTNVIELRNMLHGWHNHNGECDPELQQVFYNSGIGTYKPKVLGVEVPVNISATIDQAVAWSFSYYVVAGYIWLANRYRKGDKICIFGFSRGAYTARVLAGMLSKVGLLPQQPDSTNPDPKKLESMAWKAFQSYELHGNLEAWEHSAQFRKDHKCRSVPVHFLGCWDTVNSVGLVVSKRLPFTSENPIVRTFRHAIALDEHRARFAMNMWGGTEDDNGVDADEDEQGKEGVDEVEKGILTRFSEWWSGPAKKAEQEDLEQLQPPIHLKTDEEEVWFAGAHCDIGGGSVPTATRPNLAHIPLRWMIRECFKTESGIIFKENMLRDNFGLDPKLLYPVYIKERPRAHIPPHDARVQKPKIPGYAEGTWNYVKSFVQSKPEPEERAKIVMAHEIEEELDMKDALAPMYDQLEIKPLKWAAMEYHPQKQWVKKDKKYERSANKYKGRKIPHPVVPGSAEDEKLQDKRLHKIRVHVTVRTRMQTPMEDGSFYVPKALMGGQTFDKVLDMVHWVHDDKEEEDKERELKVMM